MERKDVEESMEKYIEIRWYVIGFKIKDTDSPAQFEYLDYKDDIGVSSHTKLCGSHNGAMLDSEELAISYLKELEPIFKKRYSFDHELKVIERLSYYELDKRDKKKITQDSLIVRARIKTRNFASNKKVEI